MPKNKVITRFAPSPTGYLHAGGYRTALFNWIFARQNGGKFVLRIEDTDKIRSKKEFDDNILDTMKWLKLDYDEFDRQSNRTALYRKYLDKLIADDKAYISKEAPQEEGHRSEVIRFRNPNKKVSFDDLIRGKIEFDTTELGDFVIAKSLDEPIFHLSNVIDDHEMGITHVIRGEDHISNTPRQMLIFEAIGAPIPKYAHIPLILASDRSKLSKRNGALPVSEYRSRGFLPEAIINYLVLLGWHPSEDVDFLTVDDIIKNFSLERVQKGGAIFDSKEEKLTWLNHEHIIRLKDKDFLSEIGPFLPKWVNVKDHKFTKSLGLIKEKIKTLKDVTELLDNGELSFIKETISYPKEKLLWKDDTNSGNSLRHLHGVFEILTGIKEKDFTAENIKLAVWPYAEKEGRGNVLWPMRMALSGLDKSPDPFISAFILGQEESLKRIKNACKILES